ncbi:Signal transduction histidine kinase [Streptoalloteichus tenebrarius]|uniref:histidine kinase n=2 Tax=Streptoalloteichus tenebrarius (strain ATCC 17920 / DSM 40477 / JCM 4838 / CBS 697.72 / NBRC 16177 / NCIMB 11028 / NRRL B-12390 / A12253. 1 / ISP 5477) TaxID=1933 RepID=A0ABT1HMQ7_STRSD|nr:Signal transduction histidine kinase [Streptoalloteichus tenebrarius]BFF00294.1 histidine kinase [Streptoalloteichus tenebrarius]
MVRPFLTRATYGRWVFLLLGGVFLVPYVALYAMLFRLLTAELHGSDRSVGAVLSVIAVAISWMPAFIPGVRVLEAAAARALLDADVPPEVGAPTSWSARWRAAAWFVLHMVAGGLLTLLLLVVLPFAVLFLVGPYGGGDPMLDALGVRLDGVFPLVWVPLAGLVVIVGTFHLGGAVGAWLGRCAPAFLGPSAAERLAELAEQADQLAERNRLARELHDSVGHALTITTLQASAAHRLLETDREFVRDALLAIEETGRSALEDLDHVLGLLRDGAASTKPQPTLADLDRLLAKTRSTGVTVDARMTGDVRRVPLVVSREAYRIVQEGLTNALRHAGKVPVTVRLAVDVDELELEMSNPIDTAPRKRARDGGGRGLKGINERVAILRGAASAGPEDGRWRVVVRLPLRAA